MAPSKLVDVQPPNGDKVAAGFHSIDSYQLGT